MLLVQVGRGVNHGSQGVGATAFAPVAALVVGLQSDSGHVNAAELAEKQILKKS